MAEHIDKMAAVEAINEYCNYNNLTDGDFWAGLQIAKQIILEQVVFVEPDWDEVKK